MLGKDSFPDSAFKHRSWQSLLNQVISPRGAGYVFGQDVAQKSSPQPDCEATLERVGGYY